MKMMRVAWDEEEMVALTALYYSIYGVDSTSRDNAINTLTRQLQFRASVLGIPHDEKYRNHAGISMMLMNVRSLDSEGSVGLSASSQLMRSIFWMRKTQRDYFDQILFEFDKHYPAAPFLQAKSNIYCDSPSKTLSSDELDSLKATSSIIDSAPTDENQSIVYSDLIVKNVNVERLPIVAHDEKLLDGNKSFGDFCGCNPVEYETLPFSSLEPSGRVANRLSKSCASIADFLRMNVSDFLTIPGLGMRSFKEMVSAIHSRLLNQVKHQQANTCIEMVKLPTLIKSYQQDIRLGSFNFLNDPSLSVLERTYGERLKEDYDLLGEEIYRELHQSLQTMSCTIHLLEDYIARYTAKEKHLSMLKQLIATIPLDHRTAPVGPFIIAFRHNPLARQVISNLYCSCDDQIDAILKTGSNIEEENYPYLIAFLKWCTFSIADDIETILATLNIKPRVLSIVQMRANGYTLEQVGRENQITRERVRQIEAKAIRVFSVQQSRLRTLQKIVALRNGDSVLTKDELFPYFGEHASIMLYLLSFIVTNEYTYSKALGAILIGSNIVEAEVESYVDALPDNLKKEQLSSILQKGEKEYGLLSELVQLQIEKDYELSGNRYHRGRLSLTSMYRTVLEKDYPDGIHAYDQEALRGFRESVLAEFGPVKQSETDRALTARIAAIGVLCDRGTYRAKQEHYIPNELTEKIRKYMEESDKPIFLTNTLFAAFEDELRKVGVNNKYFLQGILKQLYGDVFYFSRDYISKDASVTSLYAAIIDFIMIHDYPVSKAEIQREFPGVSDIVIQLATSDPQIINFFGEYLHVNKLRITSCELETLTSFMDGVLSDHVAHNGRVLFDLFKIENNNLLDRLGILYPYPLFSVLEYLFQEKYQFQRPFIALQGVEIHSLSTCSKLYLSQQTSTRIDALLEHIKSEGFGLFSVLEYIDSLNDEYLYQDQDHLASIPDLGVTLETCSSFEECILLEIHECTPIAHLSSLYSLPLISVPWNEWLVYSILKKWSTKLDVAMTSSQYRYSKPLVAPKGGITDELIARCSKQTDNDSVVHLDNLEDLDSVLINMIAEDDDWHELL